MKTLIMAERGMLADRGIGPHRSYLCNIQVDSHRKIVFAYTPASKNQSATGSSSHEPVPRG